jgi:hypothetical protein
VLQATNLLRAQWLCFLGSYVHTLDRL